MGISGNLKTMALAELLQWLSQGQKTGTLVIDNGKVEKRIFFKQGMITSSASTDPKEYLGHFLVSNGHVSEEAVNQAVARQEQEKLLIGKILVDMGSITEDELHKLLQLKAEESIYDIFTWEAGEFKFLDGQVPEKTMIPMRLDVQWIVLEGSRRLDEWNRVREIVPSPLTVPVLVVDLSQHEIEEVDRRILSWVDDDRTVEDISQTAKTSLFQVSQTIAQFVKQGYLKAVRPRIVEVEVPAKSEIPEDSGYYRIGDETGHYAVAMPGLAAPGLAAPGLAAPVAPAYAQHPHPYATIPLATGPQSMPVGAYVAHPGYPSVAMQPAPMPMPPPAYLPPSAGVDVGGRTLHFAAPQPGFAPEAQTPQFTSAPPPAAPPPAAPPPAAPQSSAAPATEAERLIQQAETALTQGELDQALQLFRQAKTASGAGPAIERLVQQGETKVQQALERAGFKLNSIPKLKCGMEELTKLKISPAQGFMLTRVNGSYDVQSLLKLSPMAKLDAQILFWQLSKSGHIAVKEGAASSR